jgi:hypothetical protein
VGRERGPEPAPLFSCCGYAQLIHRPLETDQDRIVNSALLGRHGHPLCLSFTTVSGFVSRAVQFRLHTRSMPPQSPKAGEFDRGVHERIKYAGFEAKKAANRNDEAEGAETEIH